MKVNLQVWQSKIMHYFKKIIMHILWRCSKIIPRNKYFFLLFIKDFLNCKYLGNINLRNRVWCLFKGFLPYEYLAYDFPKNDYRNYLPTFKNYKKASLNGDSNAFLSNKIEFEKHIKPIISGIRFLHLIESIGYIKNGNLQSLNKSIVAGEFVSLISFLQKNDLILKPIYGSNGKEVLLLQMVDDYFLIQNRKLNLEELIQYLKGLNRYLIQERFNQQGFSHEIYPGSVNTMRIATMIDPVTKQSFIAYAAHRFGSLKSGNTDNVNQGGVSSLIDIDSGKLSMCLTLSNNGKIESHESHPLSCKPIYNQQIPNWENLKNSLIEMANKMPYFKYVGWDLVLSNEEIYILEGNNCPGGGVQIHKPFSEYNAAWSFFQHYKFFN
jgi:hypothetical protein